MEIEELKNRALLDFDSNKVAVNYKTGAERYFLDYLAAQMHIAKEDLKNRKKIQSRTYGNKYVEVTKSEFESIYQSKKDYKWALDIDGKQTYVETGKINRIDKTSDGHLLISGERASVTDAFDIQMLNAEMMSLTHPLVDTYTYSDSSAGDIGAVFVWKDVKGYSRKNSAFEIALDLSDLKDPEKLWSKLPHDVQKGSIYVTAEKDGKIKNIAKLAENVSRDNMKKLANIIKDENGKVLIISSDMKTAVSNSVDFSKALDQARGKQIYKAILQGQGNIMMLEPSLYKLSIDEIGGKDMFIRQESISELNKKKPEIVDIYDFKAASPGNIKLTNIRHITESNGTITMNARYNGKNVAVIIPNKINSPEYNILAMNLRDKDVSNSRIADALVRREYDISNDIKDKIQENRDDPKMQRLVHVMASVLDHPEYARNVTDHFMTAMKTAMQNYENATEKHIDSGMFEVLQNVMTPNQLDRLDEEYDLYKLGRPYTQEKYEADWAKVEKAMDDSRESTVSRLADAIGQNKNYIQEFTSYWISKNMAGEQTKPIDLETAMRAYDLREFEWTRDNLDHMEVYPQIVHNLEQLSKLEKMQCVDGYSVIEIQRDGLYMKEPYNLDVRINADGTATMWSDTMQSEIDHHACSRIAHFVDQPTKEAAITVAKMDEIDIKYALDLRTAYRTGRLSAEEKNVIDAEKDVIKGYIGSGEEYIIGDN